MLGELQSFIVDSPSAAVVEPRSRPKSAYPPVIGRSVPVRTRATTIVPEFVDELISRVDDAVPESMVNGLRSLLMKYQDVFSQSEYDLGLTDVVTHRIETEGARPVRQQRRRYPLAHLEAISKHVTDLLQQGVIEPAASPWAFNIVLVRKKDNTYWCCVDYTRLNDVTVKDKHPLPRVDSCIEAMAGACWFSTIGMYRYKTMPFRLCNAGATFQRLMDIVMAGLHLDVCLVYLDDVVVYSRSASEHLQRLDTVFQRLRSAGLKLMPEKCVLFRRSIVFLGHVLSADGIATDAEKTRAVAS